MVHHVRVFVGGLVMQCPVKAEEHDLGRENDEDEVGDGLHEDWELSHVPVWSVEVEVVKSHTLVGKYSWEELPELFHVHGSICAVFLRNLGRPVRSMRTKKPPY